jgi:8-oxo-dGTP pyrophosphatase MutT (NUDIX family)
MQITVYVHNKPVYLVDALDEQLEKWHHQPDTIFIDELDVHTIKSMLHEISLPEIRLGIFLHPNLEELKSQFLKKFEVHVAGGGLVTNEKGEMLMIFRRGFWDLPKGHMDKGETIEECALREVREETGLKNLELKQFLITTYHSYGQGTHHIMKESHWFLMSGTAAEKLVPQTDEDIDEIEWVAPENSASYLENAYPSIRDVVKEYNM